MPTTWNPADMTAGSVLSSGNHVISGSSGNYGARATFGRSAGKYYLEMLMPAAGSAGVGLGVPGSALASAPPMTILHYGGINEPSGAGYAGTGISALGKRVGFAVNLGTGKCAIIVDGVWYGRTTPNPSIDDTGMFLLSPFTGPVFPMCYFQNTGAVTINSGDSAFTYAVPTGYTAWDATLPYTQTQTAVLF